MDPAAPSQRPKLSSSYYYYPLTPNLMTDASSRKPKPAPSPAPEGPSSDNLDPFPEPVAIPLEDVLDLHSVPPRDAKGVVEEYLHECYRQNFAAVRIIHGRGIGVQREMVRQVLSKLDFVESFADAPMEAGGWGATVITLRRHPK